MIRKDTQGSRVEGEGGVDAIGVQKAAEDSVAEEGVGVGDGGVEGDGAVEGGRGGGELLDSAAGGEGVGGEAGEEEVGKGLVKEQGRVGGGVDGVENTVGEMEKGGIIVPDAAGKVVFVPVEVKDALEILGRWLRRRPRPRA